MRRKDKKPCEVAGNVDYQLPMGSLPLYFRGTREQGIVTGERVVLSHPESAGAIVALGSTYAMLTGGYFIPLPANVRP